LMIETDTARAWPCGKGAPTFGAGRGARPVVKPQGVALLSAGRSDRVSGRCAPPNAWRVATAVDLREANLLLRRHRRRRLRPWLCRCGGRHPCPCRQLGEAELLLLAAGQADAARRNANRLADGDRVPVPGHERYADLLRPPVTGRASLVRPYLPDARPSR
jgi:hypothetical protein